MHYTNTRLLYFRQPTQSLKDNVPRELRMTPPSCLQTYLRPCVTSILYLSHPSCNTIGIYHTMWLPRLAKICQTVLEKHCLKGFFCDPFRPCVTLTCWTQRWSFHALASCTTCACQFASFRSFIKFNQTMRGVLSHA